MEQMEQRTNPSGRIALSGRKWIQSYWAGLGAFLGGVIVIVLAMAGVSGPAPSANTADIVQIYKVEKTLIKAAGTKDVDLAMSLFADDVTLMSGGKTYTGKGKVRTYFATVAAPFRQQNDWWCYMPISDQTRIHVDGDRATLHFQCLYVENVTNKIEANTYYDSVLVRSDGKWLIKEMNTGNVPEAR